MKPQKSSCRHPSMVWTGAFQLDAEGKIIPTGEPNNARKFLNCGAVFHLGIKPLDAEDSDMS